jgi:hypothetical protein
MHGLSVSVMETERDDTSELANSTRIQFVSLSLILKLEIN